MRTESCSAAEITTATDAASSWPCAAAPAADMATTAKTTTTEASSTPAVGTRPRGMSECDRRDAD
jgi:hypothetical protein